MKFEIVRKRFLSKPCLILIVGVAPSGKTTLAKEILRRLWAVYLDNNHIVDAFFPDTRSGRDYDKLRPRFYRALYTIGEENLRLDNSVLLEGKDISAFSAVRLASISNGGQDLGA